MICALPPKFVDPLWPQFGPLIEAAIRRTGNDCYIADDIRMACKNGTMLAWVDLPDGETVRAVAVTEIHVFPRKRVCSIPWVGGREMKKWLSPMLEKIEIYAREIGCDRLSGGGRKGWIKAAGFEAWGIIVKKDIGHG